MSEKRNQNSLETVSKEERPGFFSRGKVLIENISSLFVLQAANYIFPLITLPYLVRVLGPEKFGLIVFAQTFAQYFVILTDYGFNYTATRQISIERNDIKKCSEIFSSVLFIKMALTVLGFGIMAAVIFAFPKFRPDWPLYFAAFLLVPGSALFPLWLYQGMERMKYITIINIIARTIATAAIFIFVRTQNDYILAVLFVSMGWVIIGLIGLAGATVIFRIKPVIPSKAIIRQSLIDGWHIFISTGAISLYTSSNIFILGIFTNNTIVGYFGAADKIVRAVRGLIVPVAQALYPHISALVSKSRESALEFIRGVLKWMSLGSLILSLLIFALADIIVALALGPEYQSSVLLIRIMAFLPFIIALSNVSGIQTMLTFGFNKTFSRILITAGLLNIAMIIPLIILYQATGAAVSVVITETFVTASMFFVLGRKGIHLINIRRPVL